MPRVPTLATDARADVCVVGAGIAGLTTAYLLLRAGRKVLVLDRSGIGAGETARTTAHLSSALDDGVVRLAKLHGDEKARLAVESHVAAIDTIERIVVDERIECQFERLDGVLFSPGSGGGSVLADEYAAIQRVGVSGVSWLPRAPFPSHDTGPCLRYTGQATFHPLLYLKGLARAVLDLGGRIYTNAAVGQEFDAGPPVRFTAGDGRTVMADSLVIATNAPALNFTELQARQSAMRTYAIAAVVPRGSVTRALYWDTESPYHYVRVHTDKGRGEDILIVGGEDHRTGHDAALEDRYSALETWARVRFNGIERIEARWSGQVLEPLDGLAFIGRDRRNEAIYCITGDSGHGLTHGTIGGMLITDLVVGRDNPWVELYSPSRVTLRAAGVFLREAARNVAQYREFMTPGEVDVIDDIKPRTGAIVRRGRHKIAAYRDHVGVLHQHSAVCTHMGCIVRWNGTEDTWDCPCHGSRFSAVGEVINGPAVEPLKKVDSADAGSSSGAPPSTRRATDPREEIGRHITSDSQ